MIALKIAHLLFIERYIYGRIKLLFTNAMANELIWYLNALMDGDYVSVDNKIVRGDDGGCGDDC